MSQIDTRRIQHMIDELRARMPAHSVPPRMIQELEELEELLEKAKQTAQDQMPPTRVDALSNHR